MRSRPRIVYLGPAGLALLLSLAGGRATAQPGGTCFDRLPTERVTLNLRDASAPTTLRLLAQQYKVNLIVTEEVKQQVTLDFFRVPAREVFQAIIDAGNLRCVVAGDVMRVSTVARLRAEEEDRVKTQEAQLRLEADTRKKIFEARRAEEEFAELAARGPIREETIRLRYADAEDVAKTLQGILGLTPPGSTASAVPLPQLSQLYVPSPPVDIPSTPPPPLTAPVAGPPSPSEIVAKGLTVQAYKPTNSVFIRYYEKDIARLKILIEQRLDVPVPQVQIAAQMIISTLNALEQIGVQWGGAGAGNVGRSTLVGQGFQGVRPPGTGVSNLSPVNPNLNLGGLLPVDPATAVPLGGNLVNLPVSLLPTVANPAAGLLLGIVGSNFNLNLAIQALEVKGKARTLAEPKVVTVENAKATIARGFEVPFVSTPTQGVSQVQFKEALLKLDVTPRVIKEQGDTKIRMKVVFENNEPDFSGQRSVQGNPSIFKRRQETEVLISQGQRLVVGGVTNDTNSTTVREVPTFGKIPVLGWLFKSRELNSTGEELIVILTPTVIEPTLAETR